MVSLVAVAVAIFGVSFVQAGTNRSGPVIYPIPTGMTQGTSFNVSIRSAKSPWQSVGTYSIDLSLINTTTGSNAVQKSSMAYFDFGSPVEIAVTYTKATVSSTKIRPLSYGIAPHVQGNTIKFSLSSPRNVVIQVNDNIFDCLHLLTNELEKDVPSANDTSIIYFGPGVHSTTGGKIIVPSGKTVYVAGGGVLTSTLLFQNVSNAGLRGRGLVTGTTIARSSHISINDVISIQKGNILVGTSDDVTINNFRGFSSAGWGDGMDFFCSKNIIVSNVFMRNSDDCIAIYQHRDNDSWDWRGDSKNITIKDSSLWADVAHPLNIGTHGSTENPETMSDINVSNIDILDHREMQMDYQGTIAMNPGDSNLIENVYISDVRVEDFRLGQLVNMRVMYNQKYNTSPGRGIRNVTIRNLKYDGTHAYPSLLLGYDEERTITGVKFQNLTVNGKLISDTMRKPTWYLTSDYVPMYKNEHVHNLTFID